MRHVFRGLVAATTAVAALAAQAAPAGAAEQDRAGLQTDLDQVVDGGAIGALAEVRDDRGVWRGASGVAEVGSPRAVPVAGRFRIGSITKSFVATVVLQLVGERRLRLDDTVETWLPGVVPDGHRITVRHLLGHTSGLYDYLYTLPMPPTQEFLDNRWRTWTADEMIQRALANPPVFERPGSDYAYSSTGYLLLGRIVEAATGSSYGEEIRRRIIEPLRLSGTSVPGTSPAIPQPHPHGYVPALRDGEMQLLDFTEMNPSVFGAGGEMISTTRDLNRFFAALLGGDLVAGRLLTEMKTPGVEDATYGLGLAWRETTCGVRVYGNDGDVLAYHSWSYSTEDGQYQVTLALTPDFSGDLDDDVDAFLDEAFCG